MSRIIGRTLGGLLAVLAIGLAAVLVLDRATTAAPGVRHAALHLNCPPGSHGTPRYTRFGESLGYRRDGDGAPSSLRARALTAPHATRTQSNP